MRHTKSSAALVTTKRFTDTNIKAEFLNKIEVLEYNEESRKQLLDKIEEIKANRNKKLFSDKSNSDLLMSSRHALTDYTHREKQQLFNQRKNEAISQAQERKEKLISEKYRQNLFNAHRQSIEGNIRVELRAIKIVRLWQEK